VKKSGYTSREQALKKLQRFCAYQDRCHQEVRRKLLDLQIYGDDLEQIMVELIQDNFLNEERFAQSFARGKFRIKQWGRLRIVRELKARDISEYCIRQGLKEIEETEYRKTLRQLLEKRQAQLGELEPYPLRYKLYQYAQTRGYEPEYINEALDGLLD
jgi:regulatory protein